MLKLLRPVCPHPTQLNPIPPQSTLCTSPIRGALAVPGSLLLGSFFALFFCLGYRLTGNRFSACMSIPLTMFSGGIGAWVLWENGWTWDQFAQYVTDWTGSIA